MTIHPMPRRWRPAQIVSKPPASTAPATSSELDATKAALRSAELEVASLRRDLESGRAALQTGRNARSQAEHEAVRAASSIADLSRRLYVEPGRVSELERMFLASRAGVLNGTGDHDRTGPRRRTLWSG